MNTKQLSLFDLKAPKKTFGAYRINSIENLLSQGLETSDLDKWARWYRARVLTNKMYSLQYKKYINFIRKNMGVWGLAPIKSKKIAIGNKKHDANNGEPASTTRLKT